MQQDQLDNPNYIKFIQNEWKFATILWAKLDILIWKPKINNLRYIIDSKVCAKLEIYL